MPEQDLRSLADSLEMLLLKVEFGKAKICVEENMDPDFGDPARSSDSDSLGSLDLVRRLRICSMAAEVLDYWGKTPQARQLLAKPTEYCEQHLKKLANAQKLEAKTDAERLLVRQQVWIVLHSGTCDFREGHYQFALGRFAICERIVQKYVITSEDPAWGTQARLRYCVGLVYREQGRLIKAAECFTDSLTFAYRSLEAKAEKQAKPLPLVEKPYKLTCVAIAKSLGLGLASVHNKQGRPDLAFPLLVAAKSVLMPLGKEAIITSAHVDLYYANVDRSLNGDEKAVMDSVIGRLLNAHSVFKSEGHEIYQSRAARGLVAAYLQRARLDETLPLTAAGKEDLNCAEGLTGELERSGDMRFHVFRSRIHRKRDELDAAEDAASFALEIATNPSDPSYLDALLARGEARGRRGDFDNAVEDFEKAAKATETPRMACICLLHLCRLSAVAGKDREAKRYLTDFEELAARTNMKLSVQARQLERQARAAVGNSSKDVELRISDDGITAGDVERRVHRFLVEWAKSRASTDVEGAKLLGISRPTFHNWARS